MNSRVCLTSTWTVLLHTGNITAFYCPPGVPREIEMCVLWSRRLSVSFAILHIYLNSFWRNRSKGSISIFLNDQTWEGLQTCMKSVVIIVWLSLSI